jgi:hypothetical protein
MSCQQRLDALSNAPSGEEDTPTAPTDQTPPTSKRGDAGAHGFWQCGRTAIFDVLIMDIWSCSYQNKDYKKVLVQQEKEKKNQYLCLCLEMRKDFTPLVGYPPGDIINASTCRDCGVTCGGPSPFASLLTTLA